MTGQPLPPRRSRGGQPGNSNALKHGLFSRRINPSNLYKLGANPGYAVNLQIAQLHLYLRELLEQGHHIDDFGESLTWLKNINIATGVLTRLISQKSTAKSAQSDPQAAESLIIAKYLLQEKHIAL